MIRDQIHKKLYLCVFFLLSCGLLLVCNACLSRQQIHHQDRTAKTQINTPGIIEFFTEADSLENIFSVAQQQEKPILMLFSIGYCLCGDELKKQTIFNPELSETFDYLTNVVISNRNPWVNQLISKHSLTIMPCFVLLSPDGDLVNALEPDYFFQAADINNFIGKSLVIFDFLQKVESRPDNKKLWEAFIDWLTGTNHSNFVDFRLKQTILNDLLERCTDSVLVQKVYELYASAIFEESHKQFESKRLEFFLQYNPIIETVYRDYFPDNFKYSLKGEWTYISFLDWFSDFGDFAKVDTIFIQNRNYLKSSPKLLLLCYQHYLYQLVRQERYEEARDIFYDGLDCIRAHYREWSAYDFNISFPGRMYNAFFHEKTEQMRIEFEEPIKQLLELVIELKTFFGRGIVDYAIEYNLYLPEILEVINQTIAHRKNNITAVFLIGPKAQLFQKLYGDEKTIHMLLNLDNDERFKNLPKMSDGKMNLDHIRLYICRSLKMSDRRLLEMGNNILQFDKAGGYTDHIPYLEIALAYQSKESGQIERAVQLVRDAIQQLDKKITLISSQTENHLSEYGEYLEEYLRESGVTDFSEEDKRLIYEPRCQ